MNRPVHGLPQHIPKRHFQPGQYLAAEPWRTAYCLGAEQRRIGLAHQQPSLIGIAPDHQGGGILDQRLDGPPIGRGNTFTMAGDARVGLHLDQQNLGSVDLPVGPVERGLVRHE